LSFVTTRPPPSSTLLPYTTLFRSEVFGSVLAEVTHAHPLGDRHPRSPDIGLLDDLGPALGDHLALGAGLVDGQCTARLAHQVLGPRRLLAPDDPEAAVGPFVPDGDHIRPALFVDGGQPGEHRLLEECGHLVFGEPPDLAPPALVTHALPFLL